MNPKKYPFPKYNLNEEVLVDFTKELSERNLYRGDDEMVILCFVGKIIKSSYLEDKKTKIQRWVYLVNSCVLGKNEKTYKVHEEEILATRGKRRYNVIKGERLPIEELNRRFLDYEGVAK